ARADSHSFFLDILQKIDFIKANDISEAIENKYEQKNRAVFSLQKRIFRQNGLLAFMQFFLEHGIQFIVAVIGAALMMEGDLTPGGVAVATTVFSTFLVPSLSQLIGLIKEAGSSQEIVHDIMQKIACTEEKPLYHRAQMAPDVLVRLEQAACIGRNGTIFEGASLELPLKGLLGISGMSGAGKSTLAKMIAGLLLPASGRVVYNSLYFTEEDICGKIAYLDSEPYFMEGTILENLKASGEGWDKVCEMDEIRAFLDELPDKENTVLTKDATTLSGGQRQLLGIARVLAKQNARLIILDEPTASMDEGARKRVWQIFKRLSEEKCVLIISHQKELLAEMPKKYCIKNQHLQREN
ncbi:MAG: ABC transporter ATP-binding protein/permease, partial [Lachnospiraceae bacterium]|nr:ABC transporter ATP-binding protein/permease [Lachnospiraceae bacterium]